MYLLSSNKSTERFATKLDKYLEGSLININQRKFFYTRGNMKYNISFYNNGIRQLSTCSFDITD